MAGSFLVLTLVSSASHFFSTEVSSDDIPLPFSVGGNMRGAIVDGGASNTRAVKVITFNNGEVAETLRKDVLNLVFLPSSADISQSASLQLSIGAGKRYYGYKYSSSDAASERAAQVRARAGNAVTFAEMFPGTFFASVEERSANPFILGFEQQKGVSFLYPAFVTLDRNARYAIIAFEDLDFTVRGLEWCGNGKKSAIEECDDGNTQNGDGCNGSCSTEGGFICAGTAPTVCHRPICGDGQLEIGEECDDGNTQSGDGCNSLCKRTVRWSMNVQSGTWDQASLGCNELVENGYAQWRLPTVLEMQSLLLELSSFNQWYQTWTRTRGDGNTGIPYDVWKVFDTRNGQTTEAREDAIFAGLCVDPQANGYSCTDSDNTPADGNIFEADMESIYTRGTGEYYEGPSVHGNTEDTCLSQTILREHYCMGDRLSSMRGSRDIFCPNGYGCVNGACNRELPPGQEPYAKPQCMDDADNDGDIVKDYSSTLMHGYTVGDPGCEGPFDDDESDRTTACQDGVDNDEDTLIDMLDPGCYEPIDTNEAHRYSQALVLNAVSISECGLQGYKVRVDFASNIFRTCARLRLDEPGTSPYIDHNECYFGLDPITTSLPVIDPHLREGASVKLCHGNDPTICSNTVFIQRAFDCQ